MNLIKKVFKNIEDCGKRQFILAGALMPNSAYSPSPFPILAKSFSGLKMVASDCFKKIPTDLKFNLVKISKNPDSLTAEKLIALIKPSNQKFVIFANFISRCHDIYSELVKNRITASVITSDMYIEERIEDFFDFFQDTQVLISMNIVSRGLEFNADHIVLYNLPSTLTSFVNKIGRVGRRGRPGEVTLLLNEDEIGIMEHLKPGNDWEEVYKYYAARCKKKSKFQSVLDIEVEESENE